ncbi:GNAT family N-acetyltransferase [Actinosynnema sp. NPDC023587]|uniref:GNAT family N-acetyltransferase n=1 Tax=Actinosynnema sp. NPDC023587 TaxID=3154695 RepID=UPI0033F40399
MDRVVEVEQRCADAWPALRDVPLGEWRLRAAGGFTGRANSALTTGSPGCPVPWALRLVRAFAARNAIAPTAHVVVGSRSEEAVSAAGWRVDAAHPGGAESLVLTGRPESFASPKGDGVGVSAVPTSAWWELTAQDNPTPAQRHVLGSGFIVGFGSVVRGGRVVAAVRGAVVGDLLHIARLVVRPEVRRGGVARALMGGLASWGVANGATRCALQVAEHNTAALTLYASLGCTEHHRYRYWIP